MVRVLSFPCVMLAGFALFAALSNAGWPLLASAYLPVAIAAVSVTLHERALPYRAAWRPDRWRFDAAQTARFCPGGYFAVRISGQVRTFQEQILAIMS